MDFVALTKDVGSHFGAPVTCLVTEVYACLKHLAHRHFSHDKPLWFGLSLRPTVTANSLC